MAVVVVFCDQPVDSGNVLVHCRCDDVFKDFFDLFLVGFDEVVQPECEYYDKHGDVVTPIEIWKYENGKIVTVRMENVK